ncbi:MAG: coenzyme F420-0:L-glutamate ligase [Alphaproteobacteria bacterium]
MMEILPIQTRRFNPPKDDLYDLLDTSLPEIKDGDILCITTKVLSIHQGLCVPCDEVEDKDQLIFDESEAYIPRQEDAEHPVVLSIKNHTLIPSAGIDESNSDGHYILWPRELQKLLKEIHAYLVSKYNIKNLGILATDSKTLPLRAGVVGISVGLYGFHPLKDYRGTDDLFGREMIMSQTNIADGLAATAVLMMGEGTECTPLLLFRGFEMAQFTDKDCAGDLYIDPKDDIFKPILERFYE